MSKNTKKNIFGVLILFIIAACYLTLRSNDVREVKNICSEIKTGMSIGSAKKIVASYGLLKNIASNDVPGVKSSQKDGEYFWPVAANMTMGEYACIIYHDGEKVISTEMSKP